MNNLKKLTNTPELASQLFDIIGQGSKVLDYTQAGDICLLNKKYIAILDLYLSVEARVNDLTKVAKESFYFNILISTIITLLISVIIVLYVKRIHLKLDTLASNDDVTGLPNRRFFRTQLAQFLLLKKRHDHSLSILFVDIDNFKYVNDTKNHAVGDKVLKALAVILGNNIRQSDFYTLAR
ncbi:MAG: GGDEF domain-containing protein [Colwellia sp.]|jgi:GGDEF domain-containing protein